MLIAATGELLAEIVGVYNIGIEGAMLVGALGGVHRHPADRTRAPRAARRVRGRAPLVSLLFAIAVVVFKADVVVGGLALFFLGFGITGVAGEDYVQAPAEATIPNWDIPLLSDIPYLGEALFQQLSVTYLALLLPVGVWFLLYRTRHGLNMRSIGEDPGAADVAGLSVNGWRIFYVSVGGGFAGLGGAVLTLGIVGTWLPNVTAGQGWIALAIVIFASWRPLPLIAGALPVRRPRHVRQRRAGLGLVDPVGVLLRPARTSAPCWWSACSPACATPRGGGPPWPASLGLPFFRGTD